MTRPPPHAIPKVRPPGAAARLALLLSLGAMGCRASVPLPPTEPPPAPSQVARLRGGSSVVVRRPTPETALLGLWLDVGSLDASSPAVAVAAARWLARSAGEARVYPTAIEIRALCDVHTESAASCARRLTGALSRPPPSPDEAVELRAELTALRTHWLADEGNAAEWQAFAALIGRDSEGPFGAAAHDDAVTVEAVRAFAALELRPEHALLVGAGELAADDLASFLRGTGEERPARALGAVARPGVRVRAGASAAVALAMAVPSAEVGGALARALHERFPFVRARASRQRGLSVLHVRFALRTPSEGAFVEVLSTLRALAAEHGTLRAQPAPETLEGIVQGVGEEWANRAAPNPLPIPWPVGVGVVAAPRGVADPAAELARTETEVARWVERAESLAAPRLRTGEGERGAELVLDNGARIAIERRPGDRWFAAALQLAGGAARDPAGRHGRAALLAASLISGCGSSARGLDSELEALGIRLRPVVDGDAFGLVVTAQRSEARPALELLLRCGLRGNLSSASIEEARARLLAGDGRNPRRALEASWAALLAPTAPGALAPLGCAQGVETLSAPEVLRAHAESMSAAGVKLWLAGDLGDDELASFAARRMSSLREGAHAAPPVLGSPSPIEGSVGGDAPLTVIVGLRTSASEPSGLAGEVFASALAELLGARVGEPIATFGRIAAGVAASGVALRVREDALAELSAASKEVLRDLAARRDDTWERALSARWTAHSAAFSSASGAVESALTGRRARPRSLDAELAILKRLSTEEPAFAVLRPRP
jgi:hypothetical protein